MRDKMDEKNARRRGERKEKKEKMDKRNGKRTTREIKVCPPENSRFHYGSADGDKLFKVNS
jgi:hypothetical protein